MKKVFMILLTLLLVCSLTGVAVAQETTTFKTVTGETDSFKTSTSHAENIPVTLTISQSFTVSIPDSFVLTKNENGEYTAVGDVTGQITLLDTNEKLVISLASNDYVSDGEKWYLKDGEKKQEYQMALGDHVTINSPTNLANEAVIIEILSSDLTKHTRDLHLKLVEKNPPVGDYKDELTFTVSIVDITSSP